MMNNHDFQQDPDDHDDGVMESLLLHDDQSNPLQPPPNPNPNPKPDHHHPLQSPKSPSTFNSFLDPPSYAEAIFTSFDSSSPSSSSNGNNHSHHHHNRNTLTDELPSQSGSGSGPISNYIHIFVSDPQKEQETSVSLVPGAATTFYTYLITTQTDLPEFGSSTSEFAVRRRFRDVVTLSDRLAESYRGYFVPVRPDKSTVESQVMQKQEFVEQRRAAVEKYLRKLAAHPVIRRSEELRLFLEAKGRLPLQKSTDVASRMLDGAVKLPKQLFGSEVATTGELSEVAQPAKGGRDLLRIFKELKQSVT
ncbi:hypothetical protein PIB30_057624, partial [Stylosanthes scabra]|nr:hypothetical protein [Stylosanthes scabra]